MPGTQHLVVGAPLADSPRAHISGAAYLEVDVVSAFITAVNSGIKNEENSSSSNHDEPSFFGQHSLFATVLGT